jgi:hypothetical protein
MSLRIHSLALVAALSAASSLVPAPAVAQAPDSTRRGGFRPRLAAGMDAMLFDGPRQIPALYGVVGVEWLHPRAPFSARFDLSYFRRDRDFGDSNCWWVSDAAPSLCRYDDRYAVIGASVDGRYTFLPRASMRPYLVSGFGLYRSTLAWTSGLMCADFRCAPAPDGRATSRVSSVGVGMHGGFGFAFPIRRSELTLEFVLRQQVSDIRQGYTMPVTVGIRF